MKKLLALAFVVCVLAVSNIGCGSDSGSKPAGGGATKPAGSTEKKP